MTIYIYLYCQVDERVWIESRSGHGIRLSTAHLFPLTRKGKRLHEAVCRVCRKKTRQNADYPYSTSDEEIPSSLRRFFNSSIFEEHLPLFSHLAATKNVST